MREVGIGGRSVRVALQLQRCRPAAKHGRVQAHDRFVRINGLRLRCREWGAISSPLLVLLHGGLAHAHWWDFFAPAIAGSHHVVALDLRGHGDSGYARPPAYRIADYVEDLAVLVGQLDRANIDIVGHSLGAMVAAAYSTAAPQRINSLVFVDSQLKISAAGARYMARLQRLRQPIYRSCEDAIARFRLLPTHTTAAASTLRHVAVHGVRQLPDGRWTLKFDREAMAPNGPQDLTPHIHRLRCPVLFIRGAHSTVFSPSALTKLLAAVPGAEGAEISNAHHHVMLDNPVEFEGVASAFLKRHR
jgi:pimeloyl-ACP methyl ester carboxylesterase